MAPRLTVLGDCNPDLVLTGNARPAFGQVETIVDDAALTIGGSGAITAAGAARLGIECELVATIGDDDLGRLQLSALRTAGVGVDRIAVRTGLTTGVTVVLGDGDDRAILTAPGAIPSLTSADVDRTAIEGVDHVHVASLFLLPNLHPGLPDLLRIARDAGATTSLDTNWDPDGGWAGAIAPILDGTDLLLPNLAEAKRLSGEQDPEAAARALAARVPTVVVKLGAEGAIAIERGRDELVVSAHAPRLEPVDTTGAGDSFNAGFIAARLGGASLREALRMAVACGSLATRGLGGTSTQPDLAEARAALQPDG